MCQFANGMNLRWTIFLLHLHGYSYGICCFSRRIPSFDHQIQSLGDSNLRFYFDMYHLLGSSSIIAPKAIKAQLYFLKLFGIISFKKKNLIGSTEHHTLIIKPKLVLWVESKGIIKNPNNYPLNTKLKLLLKIPTLWIE